jgi:hypothetical protein
MIPAEVDFMKRVILGMPDFANRVLPGLRAAHFRWLLTGYKAQREDPISSGNIPITMSQFKSGMVLMSSPVKEILDSELQETGVATDLLDCKIAWDRVKLEYNSPEMKRVKRADFTQMFKLYVNTGSNSDSYRYDAVSSKHLGKGWKLKCASWSLV